MLPSACHPHLPATRLSTYQIELYIPLIRKSFSSTQNPKHLEITIKRRPMRPRPHPLTHPPSHPISPKCFYQLIIHQQIIKQYKINPASINTILTGSLGAALHSSTSKRELLPPSQQLNLTIIFALQQLRLDIQLSMFPQNYQPYFYYPIFQPIDPHQHNLCFLVQTYSANFADGISQSPPRSTLAQHQSPSNDYQPDQSDPLLSDSVLPYDDRPQQGPKRKYRKRRMWLQKKYRCTIKHCSNKYSSKIALLAHKRRKHRNSPENGS